MMKVVGVALAFAVGAHRDPDLALLITAAYVISQDGPAIARPVFVLAES